MNQSYKFESRDIVIQEVEANTPKVPFAMEQPTGDLSYRSPALFREDHTRVACHPPDGWAVDGRSGRRPAGLPRARHRPEGNMRPPRDIANNFPATMHLRLYGMNANGKVYELDSACQINP